MGTDETFPPGTAAQRIEHSISALTAGFRYELLELERHADPAIAGHAEYLSNEVSLAVTELDRFLRNAAKLLQRHDVRVTGRDIEEEDRRLARFLSELEAVTHYPDTQAVETRDAIAKFKMGMS
jgi:hypothetical protein